MSQLIEHIRFPNGKEYSLEPEEDTIWKSGLEFPSEIREKALCITGLSGTGKTTSVSKLNHEEKKDYSRQIFLTFPRPKIIFFPNKERVENLNDLAKWRVIDSTFTFELPYLTKNNPLFAHEEVICKADYDALNLDEQFEFSEEVKRKFIFEVRQFPPALIEKFRKKRNIEQIAKGIPKYQRHYYIPQTSDEIQKGQYLFYQAAHRLFEQGVSVYVRTSLEGAPLRFLE